MIYQWNLNSDGHAYYYKYHRNHLLLRIILTNFCLVTESESPTKATERNTHPNGYWIIGVINWLTTITVVFSPSCLKSLHIIDSLIKTYNLFKLMPTNHKKNHRFSLSLFLALSLVSLFWTRRRYATYDVIVVKQKSVSINKIYVFSFRIL